MSTVQSTSTFFSRKALRQRSHAPGSSKYWALIQMARKCIRARATNQAAAHLSAAIRLRPNGYQAHLLMSSVARSTATWDIAESHAQHAAQLMPALPEPLLAIAAIRQAQARTDEALTWSERALALAPESHASWHAVAKAQLAQGRLRDAMRSIDRSLLLQDHHDARAFKARVLFRLGAVEEAARVLESGSLGTPERRAQFERTRATIRRYRHELTGEISSVSLAITIKDEDDADGAVKLLRELPFRPRTTWLSGPEKLAFKVARKLRFELPIRHSDGTRLDSIDEFETAAWLAFVPSPAEVEADALAALVHATAGRLRRAGRLERSFANDDSPLAFVWKRNLGQVLPKDCTLEAVGIDAALARTTPYLAISSVDFAVKEVNRPADRRKLLVCVGDGLGNIIQVSPALRRLAESLDEKIDVLVSHNLGYAKAVLTHADFVGRVFIDAPEVLDATYDMAVLTASYGHLAPPLCASRIILGNDVIPFSECEHLHEALYNLKVFERLGLVDRVDERDAEHYFIGSHSYPLPGRTSTGRIGLHAGCKSGIWDKKKWPHFAALTRRLQDLGYQVASFGSKDEHVEGTLDLTGTPLAESIDNMATCAAFVSNDSGLMHIADGLGIPLVALFGPSSLTKNRPLAASSRSLTSDKVKCSPCQYTGEMRTCSANRCLQELDVDKVLQHTLDLISRSGNAASGRC